MNTFIETWRGIRAIGTWIALAPIMCFRMAYFTGSKRAARQIMTRRSERLLQTCLIETRVSGPVPQEGSGCVICYNETSFADVHAIISSLFEDIDRGAVADVYALIPFARPACRKADIELVPRGNRQKTDVLLDRMVAAVASGERIAWGGEGRLSGRDEVTRFKVGAPLIAIRSQSPIVPVAFYGGHHCLPLGSIRPRPGMISIRFGMPIETTGLREENARDLADRTQSAVAALYADLRRERLNV